MESLLARLTDKELLYRICRFESREAAFILIQRYSHLLLACSLQRDPQQEAAQAAPGTLLHRLMKILATGDFCRNSIYKTGERFYYFLKPHSQQTNLYAFRKIRALRGMENRALKAGFNRMLAAKLETDISTALKKLEGDERLLVELFYLKRQTLDIVASQSGRSQEEVRNILRNAKKAIALQAYGAIL
jgi:DNA-directed RNA polymerase specialized sigma24 family protein